MPELPEVETLRTELQNFEGKMVREIFTSKYNADKDFTPLVGAEIAKIKRRAKYLIFDFDNKHSLLVHLGMSGRLLKEPAASQYKKHDHFALLFEEVNLVFNDPRRFGSVRLVKTKQLPQLLANLGPEPLLADFDAQYFYKIISKRNSNIKSLIMDNKLVVGIGNIYASESLFDAKIAPTRLGSSLSYEEVARLVASSKKILTAAIKNRGSSIRDYRTTAGDSGGFQKLFKAYGQKNCWLCKSAIKRIVQQQRSSFYCPKCQK